MESIKTIHSELGEIVWQIIGEDKNENLVLLANEIGLEKFPKDGEDNKWYIIKESSSEKSVLWVNKHGLGMCFYDPQKHTEQRYLRTDYSSKEDILFETEERYSRSARKNVESQRWQDISQYGSNQWAVSDLRTYLNGEFLEGLPENFRASIVPQTHTVKLSHTHYEKNEVHNMVSNEFISSDGTKVYDIFGKYKTRHTYSVVTDHIFLPTLTVLTHNDLFINDDPLAKYNYWMMEPYIVAPSMPYLVECVSVAPDLNREPRAYINMCNAAYLLNVYPMCIIDGKTYGLDAGNETTNFEMILKNY